MVYYKKQKHRIQCGSVFFLCLFLLFNIFNRNSGGLENRIKCAFGQIFAVEWQNDSFARSGIIEDIMTAGSMVNLKTFFLQDF